MTTLILVTGLSVQIATFSLGEYPDYASCLNDLQAWSWQAEVIDAQCKVEEHK